MSAILRICLVLGLCCCGCTRRATHPAADPHAARTALTTALEAWVQGAAPDSLAGKSPSITMRDYDWSSGVQLLKFQFEQQPDQTFAEASTFLVSLQLKDAQGKVRRDRSVFIVSPGPPVMIVRE